jgi:putative SOS response-associated peptidase YedK
MCGRLSNRKHLDITPEPWERIRTALIGRAAITSPNTTSAPAVWTVENGKKQPWYITRKDRAPIFMAGITNFRPNIRPSVEVGFVIVTEDSGGGMVDIHDRRPVVLKPEDARRWMDLEMPVEEAAHIAQSQSLPSEEFTWWRVSREVNRADPNNNRKELLEPVSASENT